MEHGPCHLWPLGSCGIFLYHTLLALLVQISVSADLSGRSFRKEVNSTTLLALQSLKTFGRANLQRLESSQDHKNVRTQANSYASFAAPNA